MVGVPMVGVAAEVELELDFLPAMAKAAPAPAAPTTAARIYHFLWLVPATFSLVGPCVIVTMGTAAA